MTTPTDQQLVDKARQLDEECLLVVSGKQYDWLLDLLYDDEGNPKPPQLTKSSRAFLTSIYNGAYTDTVTGVAA